MHPIRRVDPIRLTAALLFVVSASAAPQIGLAQDNLSFDPYPVFIAQENAYTRCGPSEEFYRTDPLRHGQELMVYAETDDGWLGVRPPDGSFCWIPAETADMDDGGETGTIVEDRTVAWIGTHLGRALKYRWQVQLANGEPITVIGRSEREGPDGPQLWYRIVPPSGEYRWVHRDQIVSSGEELVALIREKATRENVEAESPQPRLASSPSQTKSSRRTRPGSNDSASRSPMGQSVLQTQGTVPTRGIGDAGGSSQVSPAMRVETITPTAAAPAVTPQPAAAIGSGLNKSWQSNDVRQSVADSVQRGSEVAQSAAATVSEAMKKSGLLPSSVEFLGRPRLLEIGGPSAPAAGEKAADSNWIAGGRSTILPAAHTVASNGTTPPPVSGSSYIRPPQRTSSPSVSQAGPNPSGANPSGSILQVSGQLPSPGTASTLLPTASPAMQTKAQVSPQRIAQIEAEARVADGEGLSLIFSRLMASRATAAEVEPIARAAAQLAATSRDTVVAGRARLLAERVEQYRQMAARRDGPLATPAAGSVGVTLGQLTTPTTPAPSQGLEANPPASQSGFLVQVYSARSNSPPFALTDNTGKTVAYVTPGPGLNLRPHLNSKVVVSGTQGFLTGLNTPHILANQAARTPE